MKVAGGLDYKHVDDAKQVERVSLSLSLLCLSLPMCMTQRKERHHS